MSTLLKEINLHIAYLISDSKQTFWMEIKSFQLERKI